MKYIDDVEDDRFSLEVFECDCGFHVGLDVSYLEEHGDIEVPCPNCSALIPTACAIED